MRWNGSSTSIGPKLDKLKDLFRTLLHELMTAKTRVDAIDLSLGKL